MVLQAPDNPLAYANLGVAQYQLKDFVEAEINLTKAIELNPRIAHNWTTLGLIQFERGNFLMSVSSLTRAISENPRSAQANLYLAAVTFEQGWIYASIQALERAVELKPDHAEAHFNLAMAHMNLPKPKPKIEIVRRHYFKAIDLGAAPSKKLEAFLRNSAQ